MAVVLDLPTRVELRRPGREERLLGRRLWVPDSRVLEEFGASSWSGDYRAASDPLFAPLEDHWFVRVCTERGWHRWVDGGRSTPHPPRSVTWRLDWVRVEGAVD